jgi:O-antigen/teichoic acid export membrane protein
MMKWGGLQTQTGRRVVLGIGANAIGKAWVAIIQLVSIPVLAEAWGAERFGLWLMIMTVPTYIALTSTGFNAVAGVDIARSHLQGRIADCQRTYQSVWVLISAITGTVVLLGLFARVALAAAGGGHWGFGASEAADTATIILVYAFLVIQSSMVLAVYRGVSRYAEGTLLFDLIGLAEGLAAIAVAALGGSLVEAAIAMTLVRLFGMLVLHVLIVQREPWAHARLSAASRAEIRRLLQPALGALSIAAANALALQGVVVTIGLALGPAAAAAFASARTVARLPLQLADLVGRAVQPEMARAWFAPAPQKFWALGLSGLAFSAIATLPFAVFSIFFGDALIERLSNGHIEYDEGLFALLSFVVFAQGISNSISHMISSQMRQNEVGLYVLLIAALCTISPVIVNGLSYGQSEVAICLLIFEVAAIFIASRTVLSGNASYASMPSDQSRGEMKAAQGDQEQLPR